MNNSPEILVTGDVVTDNHIYKGKRQVTSSKSKSGTIITQTPGGAWLNYDILKHTASNVRFGLNLDENTKLDQQAFAEWYKTEDYENASKICIIVIFIIVKLIDAKKRFLCTSGFKSCSSF